MGKVALSVALTRDGDFHDEMKQEEQMLRKTKNGASEWTRTIDPHHVKVVL